MSRDAPRRSGPLRETGIEAMGIDLNSDVGELPDHRIDEALLTLISSANVACGGHAGDRESMLRVCRAAVDNGVAIGAQVSYPDRDGFGRRRLDMTPATLRDSLTHQLDDLSEAAQRTGSAVAYLKPHGALYHAAIDDPMTADVIVEVVDEYQIALLTMGFGELRERADRAGMAVFQEAFVDRGYTPDGRLVPRDQPDALVAGDAAVQRLLDWLGRSFDGAHSLCVHSDTADAVTLTRRVRATLTDHGVLIRPFTAATGDPEDHR